MLFDDRRGALTRSFLGGLLGVAGYLLLSFLTQPGALFGGSLKLAFTFCYNSRVPEALGALLGFLLWFCLGAETGLATLPFADGGRALVVRTLAHFLVMAATLSAWVLLNFRAAELPWFLSLLAAVYALIWLGRWVGWYAEVAAIRERLGLAPGPSPLKWRESLPYLIFALLLCLGLPAVLSLFDAADVPVLRALFFPYLLLPVGSFFSGVSLGRRQGFCPLYPAACTLFSLAAVLLIYNTTALFLCGVALGFSLTGSLLGAALRRRKERGCERP